MASQKELREAYKHGLLQGAGANSWYYSEASLEEYARAAYPSKTVTRPREVRDPSTGFFHRVVDRRLQFKCCEEEFWRFTGSTEVLADLYANPTETVEVDD